MNKRLFVAVHSDLKSEFDFTPFADYVRGIALPIHYFSHESEILDLQYPPFVVFAKEFSSAFLSRLEDTWFFMIGDAQAVAPSQNLFSLDRLEGEAPRKLFKIVHKQFIASVVSAVKEDAYDLALALCMRAAQYFRQLLDDPNSKEFNSFIELSVDFLAAHERFYSSADEEELMASFNDYIRQHGIISHLEVVSGDDNEAFLRLSKEGYAFMPLFFDDRGSYLAYRLLSSKNPDHVAFYLFALLDVFSRFVHSMDQYRSSLARNNLWEEVFALLGMPVSLISAKGELLLHNQEFLKLGILPNQCLNLNDGAEFEKDQVLYKVYRKQVGVEERRTDLFSFVSIETAAVKRGKNISFEQLGIISSSIAHELNNPIGGILAALSLLELEDYWDDDGRMALKEMKKSAERCKNLVQIFLGFSRTSSRYHTAVNRDFTSAFEQALNLVRFRMIESNSYLTIDYRDTNQTYGKEFNTSAVAMVFYLILSEVLTLFSHRRLIAGQDHAPILAKISQYDDRVEIEFNEGLNLEERLNNSKLMSQLLDMEGLSLYVDGHRIIFQ